VLAGWEGDEDAVRLFIARYVSNITYPLSRARTLASASMGCSAPRASARKKKHPHPIENQSYQKNLQKNFTPLSHNSKIFTSNMAKEQYKYKSQIIAHNMNGAIQYNCHKNVINI
jgi:hypothetical protein